MTTSKSDQVPLLQGDEDITLHELNHADDSVVTIDTGGAPLTADAASGSFRPPQNWDPIHIITQIIVLQLIYYAALAVVMLVLGYGVLGVPISAEIIFNWQHLYMYTLFVTMLFLITSGVMSIAVWKIVKRSRLCWDFAATLYFNHLLVTWFFVGHFPFNLFWWALMIACAALTTICAEQLCMHTEMKAIPVRQQQLSGRRIDV